MTNSKHHFRHHMNEISHKHLIRYFSRALSTVLPWQRGLASPCLLGWIRLCLSILLCHSFQTSLSIHSETKSLWNHCVFWSFFLSLSDSKYHPIRSGKGKGRKIKSYAPAITLWSSPKQTWLPWFVKTVAYYLATIITFLLHDGMISDFIFFFRI